MSIAYNSNKDDKFLNNKTHWALNLDGASAYKLLSRTGCVGHCIGT